VGALSGAARQASLHLPGSGDVIFTCPVSSLSLTNTVPIATPTAAETFASILRCLTHAVVTRSAFGLSPPLIALIINRIREIKQRFADLAARIEAGTYAPRRRSSTPPRPPAVRKPRPPPNPLFRKFGWLLPLVPEAVASRGHLENLLRDPEMAALLAAAPVSLARPIRSLCWMLRVEPPKILARPARPAKPRTPRPPRPKREPLPHYRPPTPPEAPAWMQNWPRSGTRWFSRTRSRSQPRKA